MIESFLDKYLPDYRDPELWLADEPAIQLAQGVDGTARGFALYSRSRTAGPHCSVIVAFPHDGGAVLGLSVDTALEEEPDASEVAEGLLTQLLDETHADEGFIGAEEPPPLSAEDWRQAMEEPVNPSVRRRS